MKAIIDLYRQDGLPKKIDEIVVDAVIATLKRRQWCCAETGRILGISHGTVRKYARSRGIEPGELQAASKRRKYQPVSDEQKLENRRRASERMTKFNVSLTVEQRAERARTAQQGLLARYGPEQVAAWREMGAGARRKRKAAK